MEELKYIVFRIGNQKYGMNLSCVNGIEQDYEIIPVPNAPKGIKGMINLRGSVIPVYSLKTCFGLDDRMERTGDNLLITISSGTALAYEVDEVVMIEQVDKQNIKDIPNVVSNNENLCLQSVLQINSEIVITINVDNVLSEDAKKMVEQIIEDNQQE